MYFCCKSKLTQHSINLNRFFPSFTVQTKYKQFQALWQQMYPKSLKGECGQNMKNVISGVVLAGWGGRCGGMVDGVVSEVVGADEHSFCPPPHFWLS